MDREGWGQTEINTLISSSSGSTEGQRKVPQNKLKHVLQEEYIS